MIQPEEQSSDLQVTLQEVIDLINERSQEVNGELKRL